MTPASEILKRCGGPKVVAEWLGLDRSAVQRWAYPSPKGSDEQVPMKHWAALIREAAKRGRVITVAELMPDEVAEIARAQQAA